MLFVVLKIYLFCGVVGGGLLLGRSERRFNMYQNCGLAQNIITAHSAAYAGQKKE